VHGDSATAEACCRIWYSALSNPGLSGFDRARWVCAMDKGMVAFKDEITGGLLSQSRLRGFHRANQDKMAEAEGRAG